MPQHPSFKMESTGIDQAPNFTSDWNTCKKEKRSRSRKCQNFTTWMMFSQASTNIVRIELFFFFQCVSRSSSIDSVSAHCGVIARLYKLTCSVSGEINTPSKDRNQCLLRLLLRVMTVRFNKLELLRHRTEFTRVEIAIIDIFLWYSPNVMYQRKKFFLVLSFEVLRAITSTTWYPAWLCIYLM